MILDGLTLRYNALNKSLSKGISKSLLQQPWLAQFLGKILNSKALAQDAAKSNSADLPDQESCYLKVGFSA
ncbi:MAG: hypothetical protein WA919_21650 [Coleofasciculaceae cyanobacterium]